MAINQVNRQDIEAFDGSLYNYQALATRTAIYPGQGTPMGLIYVALKMNGEAGELAEHIGKAMRDDDLIRKYDIYDFRTGEITDSKSFSTGELTPDRRQKIIKEIGDVLWYLSATCNELGITLSEAAIVNLEKLASRTERGTLQGSGDDR